MVVLIDAVGAARVRAKVPDSALHQYRRDLARPVTLQHIRAGSPSGNGPAQAAQAERDHTRRLYLCQY
ncbi:hypothetical protein CR103_10070 [Massilia psychrophila]|uniref:Uncharacterized protein n=1 Tax=Massilia psychrophila TaxID=1603353 RepID=A0A2G8T2D0_9BURK|nr:hypothetical protein CR103_10070 [Massilia psychrophila]